MKIKNHTQELTPNLVFLNLKKLGVRDRFYSNRIFHFTITITLFRSNNHSKSVKNVRKLPLRFTNALV